MGEMATGLAHELNQPLSAIANYARGVARRLHNHVGDHSALIDIVNSIADEATPSEIIRSLKRYVKKSEARRFAIEINTVVKDAARVVANESAIARSHSQSALCAEPAAGERRSGPVRADRHQPFCAMDLMR